MADPAKEIKPLFLVQLLDEINNSVITKGVPAMSDTYLNFVLTRDRNKAVLEDIANIFCEEYNKISERREIDSHVALIKGETTIESEIKSYVGTNNINVPKNRQDYHLWHRDESVRHLKGIEFQKSSASSKTPVPERSELPPPAGYRAASASCRPMHRSRYVRHRSSAQRRRSCS